MRWLLFFFASMLPVWAQVPEVLTTALKNFRADGAPGWSFLQKTAAGKESLVERYDAKRLDFERWSLVEKNGRDATADEKQDYLEKQTRRSRGGTAPKITDSFDLATTEVVTDTPERTTYRCRMKQMETGDKTAPFLRATLVLHKPTQTIESIELSNTGEFSPSGVVKIKEMKTVMTFSVPTPERPSVLLSVTTHLRGRAFFFKSLDEDMTVTRTEFVNPFPKR